MKVSGQLSALVTLPLEKYSTLIRGKVGSRSSLDVVEKRKISAFTNIEPTTVETVA